MADDRGRFVWYDLMTTDPKEAAAFYTKIVGWGTQPFDSMPYTMWTTHDNPIGGVRSWMPCRAGAAALDRLRRLSRTSMPARSRRRRLVAGSDGAGWIFRKSGASP